MSLRGLILIDGDAFQAYFAARAKCYFSDSTLNELLSEIDKVITPDEALMLRYKAQRILVSPDLRILA